MKTLLIVSLLLFCVVETSSAGVIDWMQRSATNQHLKNLEDAEKNKNNFQPIEGERYVLTNIIIWGNRTQYNWIDKKTGDVGMWWKPNYMQSETPELVKEVLKDVYKNR